MDRETARRYLSGLLWVDEWGESNFPEITAAAMRAAAPDAGGSPAAILASLKSWMKENIRAFELENSSPAGYKAAQTIYKKLRPHLEQIENQLAEYGIKLDFPGLYPVLELIEEDERK